MSSTVLNATASTDTKLTVAISASCSTATPQMSPRVTPAARAIQMAHRMTFHLPALLAVVAVMSRFAQPAQEQEQEEEGFSVAEWVVGVAIVVGLAIAVGAVITSKVNDKANSINLG